MNWLNLSVLFLLILKKVFAFGIGVGCVLFSFNLVRSVYSSNEGNPITPGDFPKAQKPVTEYRNATVEEPLLEYQTFDERNATVPLSTPPETNQGENQNKSMVAIIRTFTDYIRIY